MSKVNTAPVKWAQRSDSLYLTIALADIKDETINLTDTGLIFKGKSQDKDYEINIDFFKAVDAEGSKYNVLPRSVQMHVMKKAEEGDEDKDEDEETFWPRLLKDKSLEKNQVKIDWDRYVDEDEEKEGFDTSGVDGGMDMGGMGGGGMPGMGGAGGGMGGMDMEALMKQMGGMPGMGGGDGEDKEGEEGNDGDDDLDDLPDLEE